MITLEYYIALCMTDAQVLAIAEHEHGMSRIFRQVGKSLILRSELSYRDWQQAREASPPPDRTDRLDLPSRAGTRPLTTALTVKSGERPLCPTISRTKVRKTEAASAFWSRMKSSIGPTNSVYRRSGSPKR
jgi:hypothetical protein